MHRTDPEVVPSFCLGSMCLCRSPALQTATATQSSSSDNCVLVPDSCKEVDPTNPQTLHDIQEGFYEQKIDNKWKDLQKKKKKTNI